MKILALVFLSFLGLSGPSYAFPELVTHGYVNCTACHVSPTGGGALSEYGRGLSRELLSRWGKEGEEKFLMGFVKPPDWLVTGGDLRMIQTYFENSRIRQRQFFLMQADVTFGARFSTWSLVGNLGIAGGPPEVPTVGTFTSRSHYIMKQISETIELRAGKFIPQFGINEPNHTIVTRSLLGLGENSETYNLEAAYLGERFDFFATAMFGRPDDPNQNNVKGAALSSSFNFLDKNKIGLSLYSGVNNQITSNICGLWGMFSVARDISLVSEIDWLEKIVQSSENTTHGPVLYQRLAWEMTKGFQLYGSYQFAQTDLSQGATEIDGFGPGFDFFPRPHFEMRAEYLKQRQKSMSEAYGDMAWFLVHYYF